MTPEHDRFLSSFHESGHAFSFAFYGAARVRAWLTPTGGGCCKHKELSNAFHRLVSILAGEAAEEIQSANDPATGHDILPTGPDLRPVRKLPLATGLPIILNSNQSSTDLMGATATITKERLSC
jgi:hypothetical protein